MTSACTKSNFRCIYYRMEIVGYDRKAVVEYAKKWAYARNPEYYNFDRIGGDCTNFASQCLFAGCKIMNFTPEVGWYYRALNDRAAAWTGVEFFYRFLTGNVGRIFENAEADGYAFENVPVRGGIGLGKGPFAVEVPLKRLRIGDFVQLGHDTGDFYHTPVVVGFLGEVPLLAAHSYDTFDRPLTSYRFERLRCLHVLGVRKE